MIAADLDELHERIAHMGCGQLGQGGALNRELVGRAGTPSPRPGGRGQGGQPQSGHFEYTAVLKQPPDGLDPLAKPASPAPPLARPPQR